MPYIALLQSTYGTTAIDGKNWSTQANVIGQFFFPILATIFVLVLAYYSTKWIAGAKYNKRRNSNMRIIEGMSVGYQSFVQLIQVGEKYILVGVTKDRITFLTELDKTDISVESTEDIEPLQVPFEKYLTKYFKNSKNK